MTSRPASAYPRASVLLPTFDRADFLPRALGSLFASTFTAWELIIVDDGSTDTTETVLQPWLTDPRVRYLRRSTRGGLGSALNMGLDAATAPLIAYLPSDDTYRPAHLAGMVELLGQHPQAAAAVARLDWDDPVAPVPPIQLVQVMHRATPARWVDDEQLVTDDLERMLWAQLRQQGQFVHSATVSCTWTQHPDQRSRRIRESSGGGLNPFRARYRPTHPLQFHSSEGEPVDEASLYQRFATHESVESRRKEQDGEGLRILLVGELAYNPERVLAFTERGHQLFGLWTPDPSFFNTVGPLPFGSCTDLSSTQWRTDIERVRPDVIYALLNWQAIPFAHKLLTADLGIPFVWHFKEGPWFALQAGTWPQLVDLCCNADATVFSSPEQLAWFDNALAGRLDPDRCLVIDGDLPKRDWLDAPASPLLSEVDGQPHTAVLGRPMGIDPAFVGRLARAGIHTHFHGLVRSEAMARHWGAWIDEANRLAPDHFHLERAVHQPDWVTELSRYDGAWLHVFQSRNGGDIAAATWEDLNLPARLGTMGVAGLPPIQRANSGAAVATQTLTRRLGVGFEFEDDVDFTDLRAELDDEVHSRQRRAAMWQARDELTFDAHVDRLLGRFQQLAACPARSSGRPTPATAAGGVRQHRPHAVRDTGALLATERRRWTQIVTGREQALNAVVADIDGDGAGPAALAAAREQEYRLQRYHDLVQQLHEHLWPTPTTDGHAATSAWDRHESHPDDNNLA